jgi:hypothetical protein
MLPCYRSRAPLAPTTDESAAALPGQQLPPLLMAEQE